MDVIKEVAPTESQGNAPPRVGEEAYTKADTAARAKFLQEAAAKEAARTKASAKTNENVRAKAGRAARAKVVGQSAGTKAREAARTGADQETRQASAELESRANVEEVVPTKVEEAARVTAEDEIIAFQKLHERQPDSASPEANVIAIAESEFRANAEEAAPTKVEEVARVLAEDEIVTFQRPHERQPNSDSPEANVIAVVFESIAAETIDYSKKSAENGAVFVEKLLGASSFERAI